MRVIDIHPGSYYVPAPIPGYPDAVRSIPCLDGKAVDGSYALDPSGNGGTSGEERICVPPNLHSRGASEACPIDGTVLSCVNDYIGGGSHYWHLRCDQCSREYYFDTYRFCLEPRE